MCIHHLVMGCIIDSHQMEAVCVEGVTLGEVTLFRESGHKDASLTITGGGRVSHWIGLGLVWVVGVTGWGLVWVEGVTMGEATLYS